MAVKKQLTPEAYKELIGIEKLGWDPVYIRYKTKKERDYSECDCCGHKVYQGWIAKQYPIGKPTHYEYHQPNIYERIFYQSMLHWQDSIHSRMIFNTEAIGGKSNTIKFTRYANDDKA